MSTPLASSQTRTLDQALPGIYVDTIRFGLPRPQARDRKKVWGVCVRIAMSAQRRGWSEAQFTHEVARNESHLWQQLRTLRGHRQRPLAGAYRDLHKAWLTAQANLRNAGIRTVQDVRDDAVERAFQWTDRLTDGLDNLTEGESGVMSYDVAETERRQMLRVTCPGRDVAEFAKLPHKTAARRLQQLTQKGLLIKHYAGWGGPRATGRAAIYELADPSRTVQRAKNPCARPTALPPASLSATNDTDEDKQHQEKEIEGMGKEPRAQNLHTYSDGTPVCSRTSTRAPEPDASPDPHDPTGHTAEQGNHSDDQ